MSVRKFSAKLAVAALATAGLSLSAVGAAHATIPTPTDGQEKFFDLSNSGLMANATIGAGAIVGTGSDTIQFLDGDLAEAYNASKSKTVGSAGSITSLSSCQAPGATAAAGPSTLTSCDASGNFAETFPSSGTGIKLIGDSGGGAKAIDGNGNTANTPASGVGLSDVAFGRGSGVKNPATVDNLPFAVDQLVAVVSNKVASKAPANITLNELAGIYSGVYTNWAQLGGQNAPIHAYYINYTGSGTYQFFGKQLEAEEGKSTADNGVAAYAPHGTLGASTAFVSNVDLSGNPIKEHDPSAVQNDPDAITAMSYSRVKLSAGENGGTPAIKPLGGYVADRAVYTTLRDWVKDGADVTKPALKGVPVDWIANVPASAFATGAAYDPANATTNPTGESFATYSQNNLYATLFGPSGYFCNSAQKGIIEQEGFFQLDSSVCGKDVSADPALVAADMPAISKTSGTLPSTGTAGSTQVSATVAPKSGTGTPTGSVTFTLIPVNAPSASLASAVSGGSVTAALSGGVATATIPATVPAGTYQVAATYSGDTAFQASWTDYDVTAGSSPVPSTIKIGAPATVTPPVKKLTPQQQLKADKKLLKKDQKQLKHAKGAKAKKLKKEIAKLKKQISKLEKQIKKAKKHKKK